MAQRETRRDKIIVTVVASVTSAVVLAIVWAVWPSIASVLRAAWESITRFPAYLGSDVAVPRWWYWTLCTVSGLLSLTAAFIAFRVLTDEIKEDKPDYYAFDRMMYWGFEWRWRWKNGMPAGVWCFCSCGRRMLYANDGFSHREHMMVCSEEKHRVLNKHMHVDEMVKIVTHEIRHRVETGTWRDLA